MLAIYLKMEKLLIITYLAFLAISASIQSSESHVAGEFDPSVEAYRATVARQNLKLIEAHNRDPTATYKMKAYRQFVTLTPEEVRQRYLMDPGIAKAASKVPEDLKVEHIETAKHIAKATFYLDLNSYYPTPVRNQGQCGNCYAYATTDTVNMMNLRAGRRYPLISIQELTQCSGGENRGCGGGWIYDSMRYQMSNGLYSLNDYPINPLTLSNAVLGPCRTLPDKPKYYIRSASAYTRFGCADRINTLLYGYAPAIVLGAGTPNFYNYQSGILPDCYYYTIDHAAVLVGVNYDQYNPYSSYLKIKNSWGVGWGEGGFVRIGMGGSVCLACYFGVFATQ